MTPSSFPRSGASADPRAVQHRTLREAAKATSRTKGTYLGAQYIRLRGRRGPAKATTAVGHSILVAAYDMLRDGVTYHELGSDWFDRLTPDQHARRLARQIEALGFTVTIQPAA